MKNKSQKGSNHMVKPITDLVVSKTVIRGGHVVNDDELLNKSQKIVTCVNCGFLINLDFKGTSSPCIPYQMGELNGIPVYRMPKQIPCPNPINQVKYFPELKFKNGDFEKS